MSSRTREKLLEAVEDLMCTQGLARIGTRDIARAAELADGTLYNHFRSKDEIVIAVLERNVPKFRETLRDLPLRVGQHTVQQNLEEVADAAFKFYAQTAPLICSLFADMSLLESARKKLRDLKIGPERTFEVVAAYLAAEQRMGRIAQEVDAEAAVALLLDTIFGLAVFDHFLDRRPSASDKRQRILTIVATLMAGLDPRSG